MLGHPKQDKEPKGQVKEHRLKPETALPYEVKIMNAENGGLIVDVGCKKFVYGRGPEERARLVQDLTDYLRDPHFTAQPFNVVASPHLSQDEFDRILGLRRYHHGGI